MYPCPTVSGESEAEIRLHWTWSYGILFDPMWVQGIERKSSARATSALYHYAISPVPRKISKIIYLMRISKILIKRKTMVKYSFSCIAAVVNKHADSTCTYNT